MAHSLKMEVASSTDDVKPLDTKGKVCLFNVVLYLHSLSRLEYFQSLLKSITEKFPCRVLLIKKDDREKGLLKTKSEVLCSGKEQPVICEQFQIEVSGDRLKEVPFYIYPQLVPDAPVYLIWGQDPTQENEILPPLEKFANRLIFDSECANDLSLFAERILQKIQTAHFEIVDMNWSRFQGWRKIFAQAFNSPQKLKTLQAAQRITIRYNSKICPSFQHCEIQALYMQAWLSHQLNWKFLSSEKQDHSLTFHYTYQKTPLQVDLIPASSDTFSPGTFLNIQIRGYQENDWNFVRTEQQPHSVKIEVSCPETCDLPYNAPLSSRNHDFAFVRELLYRPVSSHYTSMLQSMAKKNKKKEA